MSGPKVGYKHFWPIAVLVITGVLLTTIVALFIQQWEQSKVRAEFVHVTVDNLRAIRGTLAWHVELLEATTALHTAVPALTHEEFTSFVQPLLATRPAIETIAWLPHLPAAEQQYYRSVIYHDRLLLTKENLDGQVTLQLLQPLHFTATLALTTPAAITSQAGFVAIDLRVDQVIADTLQQIAPHDIQLELYDSATQKLLYSYPPSTMSLQEHVDAAPVPVAGELMVEEQLALVDKEWRLVFRPTKAYLAENQPQFYKFVLGSSLLLISCLVFYLYLLLRRRHQSEAMLWERTEQLRQANQRLQETLQELQFQKTLLECTSEAGLDGILVVSPERKWLFYNRQFLEMWQIPSAIAAQRSSHEALHWALAQVQEPAYVKERMEALYAQPEAYATEEIRFKTGAILERFTAPVKGADGSSFGRVWYYRDVTQRQRTEEALRQSEARNRAFVNAIPDLLFRVSRDGTFWDYHSAPGYLPVMPPEKFLGRNATEVFPPPVAQALKERINHVLTTGETKIIEYDMPMLNGEMRSWEQRMVMLSEEEVMLIIRDITARKQAEAGLRYSQQQLQERQQREKELVEEELARLRDQLVVNTRFATLGQVAATIAHELRNPLGAVRNAVYYIRRYLMRDHQELLDFLQIIDMEITTADRIITDLLEMTRAKEPGVQQLDLSAIAQEIWSRSKQTEKIDFACLVPHQPFWVFADPTQLRQVLANLMTNAIQAMPDGGKLCITGEDQMDYVMITVQDSGSGVPPALRERIFEPLFTTKAKGTGLGLAICRQIIERHGGTIALHDSDQGTMFVIRLPGKAVATAAPTPA